MPARSVLEQENNLYRQDIARLEKEIKSIRDFIASDERNLQTAAPDVRSIISESLGKYQISLSQKQGELYRIRQKFEDNQKTLVKMQEIGRKEQELAQLEQREREIFNQITRARAELERLNGELGNLAQVTVTPQYELTFAGGQRVALPSGDAVLMIGCADTGVTPDVDLTPFGGTASGASRRHATLNSTQGQWTITDLGSTNGTFVNGTRISPHTPTRLQSQVQLRFGGVDATLAAKDLPVGKTTRLT